MRAVVTADSDDDNDDDDWHRDWGVFQNVYIREMDSSTQVLSSGEKGVKHQFVMGVGRWGWGVNLKFMDAECKSVSNGWGDEIKDGGRK